MATLVLRTCSTSLATLVLRTQKVCSRSSFLFFFVFFIDFVLIVRIFLSISFSSVPLRNQTLAMEEMTGNDEIRLMRGVGDDEEDVLAGQQELFGQMADAPIDLDADGDASGAGAGAGAGAE